MYARHEFHRLIGTGTGAELLVELWTSWTVLLLSSSDSLDGVQELGCQIEVLPKKAALYFCCKGSGLLLSMEGAFLVSVDRYDTAWSGHLELEVGIVRHRIESSECGSSEQCMIATTEGDDIEDQLFALEIIRVSEDHFQCD